MLDLDGVHKHYGELRALDGVTLKLAEGRIGLLGPNGAGKTTLLKVLLGLLPCDEGRAQVLGFDLPHDAMLVRARVGYMPEGEAIVPDLSALDYVTFAGELAGLPSGEARSRAHQILQYVALGEARYRRLATFSTGMRQRAKLAQALVGDPKLLLLDEPTSGLDPKGRSEMLELLEDVPRRANASLLLSTHILPDVEKTCDQVILLHEGKVLYAGALAPLLAMDRPVLEVRLKGEPAACDAFVRAVEKRGYKARVSGSSIHLEAEDSGAAKTDAVLGAAKEARVQIRHLAPLKRTLEEVFVETVDKARAPAAKRPGSKAAEGRPGLG